jgi:hypothetical protein
MNILDILDTLFKGITLGFILGSWIEYKIGKYKEE